MSENSFYFISILFLWLLNGCTNSMPEIEQQNKDVVRSAFKIVGTGDFDNMENFFTPDYTRHCPSTPSVKVNSLSEFKEYVRQDRTVITDQILTVKKLIAEGDLVAFWATYQGTQTGQMGPFPPSNKFMEIEFSGYHRLEHGKIAESWIIWDNLSALTQLGHFSAPSAASGAN